MYRVVPSSLLLVVALAMGACHLVLPFDKSERSAGDAAAEGPVPGDAATVEMRSDGLADGEPVADTAVTPDARVLSQVRTLAGNGTGGFKEGPTSEALLQRPHGLLVEGPGTVVYVAEFSNNCIRVIQNDQVQIFAGKGPGGAGFADGPQLDAQFTSPTSVQRYAGAYYVADYYNHRIRKIANGMVGTFAGDGTQGYQDGPAASAWFNLPSDVVVDSQGVAYVADSGGNRVRRIENGVVSTLAGNGNEASKDGTGEAAEIHTPHGLLLDEGNNTLYVTDFGGGRVRAIDLTTKNVSTLSDAAAKPLIFVNPSSLALDKAAQRLYVSEMTLHRVVYVDLVAGSVTVLAGTGQAGGQDGALNVAEFSEPEGLALDTVGRLYVAEFSGHRVRVIE